MNIPVQGFLPWIGGWPECLRYRVIFRPEALGSGSLGADLSRVGQEDIAERLEAIGPPKLNSK
jgi:hypothetical protein